MYSVCNTGYAMEICNLFICMFIQPKDIICVQCFILTNCMFYGNIIIHSMIILMQQLDTCVSPHINPRVGVAENANTCSFTNCIGIVEV